MIFTITVHNPANEIVETVEGDASAVEFIIRKYHHRFASGYKVCVGGEYDPG